MGTPQRGVRTNRLLILGIGFCGKKLKKNEKKNRTSEVIKRIMPHFSPLTTLEVCSP